MAEGVFRAIAAEEGLNVIVDSCGTSDWHVGEPPDPRAIAEARAAGYDIAGLRARQFRREDFRDFDLIIPMDLSNLAKVEAKRPVGWQTPVQLFMHYAPDLRMTEIPDPWETGDFPDVLRLIEIASRGLALQLASAAQTSSARAPNSL